MDNADKTIETLQERVKALGYGGLDQGSGLAVVRAVNGKDGLQTTLTIKVSIRRVNSRYHLTRKASIRQAETDTLDEDAEVVDPAQLGLKI